MPPENSSPPDDAGEGWSLYFGGPDKEPRRIRNLLSEMIEAQAAGGEIDFVTYYFRDVSLARTLIAASERGVRVRVLLEGEPRRKDANDEVIALLEAHGLKGGLRVRRRKRGAAFASGHLHTKLYAFSHPRPSVFIGSFNPSGNEPEESDVIAEIGDQDRGHNLLLRLFEAPLVEGARRHAAALWASSGSNTLRRFSASQNAAVEGAAGALWFFPRLSPACALPDVARAHVIMAAISHLKAGPLTTRLAAFARSGGKARLIVHDTERRAPQAVVNALRSSGVEIARYQRVDELPMHAKFLLVDAADGQRAFLGSLNYNPKSFWLNDELLFTSRDPALFKALSRRFATIAGETTG